MGKSVKDGLLLCDLKLVHGCFSSIGFRFFFKLSFQRLNTGFCLMQLKLKLIHIRVAVV
jgi:hypothetical protein